MNRCGSFLLLSTPHFLFSIWTNRKRSQGHQRGGEENGLANWALWTSPKFTTWVKYQFHQGFWPDQRSGNPNHPSPHIISCFQMGYLIFSVCIYQILYRKFVCEYKHYVRAYMVWKFYLVCWMPKDGILILGVTEERFHWYRVIKYYVRSQPAVARGLDLPTHGLAGHQTDAAS